MTYFYTEEQALENLYRLVFFVLKNRGPPSPCWNSETNTEEIKVKNYRDSDYAINKYSDSIVYRFADGIVEVTLEDYLRDNPDKDATDFAQIKAISDELYHQQVIDDNRINRLNVPIHAIEDSELLSSESVENQIIQKEAEKKVLDAAEYLLQGNYLTEIQRRRFVQYFCLGLSTRQIAKMEGVSQYAVWDSLHWISKKLKKIFEE